MINKVKMCTTGKILVEMSVTEIETSNVWNIYIYIYIYISKIWVCYKNCYFYIYTWDCNVSWIDKHKDQQVSISYSPSAILIPLHFTDFSLSWKKLYPLLHFLKNKQNSNSHPFCKVGEIQLRLIKIICFTYLLLIQY